MLNRVRQLKKESSGARQAGFTIIEVMIVLAIAGLIMAIVFLAIPALQRNNRNTQRKSDVARIGGLINDYVANNQGSLPTAGIVVGPATVPPAPNTLYTGTDKFSIITVPTGAPGAVPSPLPTPPAADTVIFYIKATCSGTNSPSPTASSRSFVLWYGVEGTTTTQCLDS